MLRSKKAISSVVAILMIILLLGMLTSSLILISSMQRQSVPEAAETIGEISEKTRENLEAQLLSAPPLLIKVKNTGTVTLTVTRVLFAKSDGSLDAVNIDPPVTLICLEDRTIAVNYDGSYERLGVQTERGNVFPVQTAVTQQPQSFDFSVSVSPSSGSAQQGGSATATATVSLVSGSPQTVSLSASGLPSGASYSFSPSSSFPTFTSTLTITTSPSTPTGTYTITITGSGGGLTRTTTYTLRVTSPPPPSFDFSISVSPSSVTITRGTSGSAIVTVTLISGLSQTVTLSASAPSGISTSFNPTSGNPTFASTLTIMVSSDTSAGTYDVTLTGTGGGLTRSTSITVYVQDPFDFSVSATPSSGSVQQGSSISATVTVSLVSGPTQTVSLSASGLPSGASASFSLSSGSPTFTSTITIATSSTTPTGTYTITITGTGGGLTRTATYTLTVTELPPETYTVTFTQAGLPSGTSWSVTFGSQTWSSTSSSITFTVTAGTYSWSVSSPISGGSGIQYIASPSSGSMNVPSQTSQSIAYATQYTLTISVNPSGAGTTSPAVGSYWYDSGSSVTISATPASGYIFNSWSGSGSGSYTGANNPATITMSGPIAETANFVVPFDFSVSVSPSSGSVQQGNSISATVTVTLLSGSTQTVALSASGQPSGVSVGFSTSSGNPTFTSTLVITAQSNAPTGTYTITVAGAGGGLTRTATYTLSVTQQHPATATVTFSASGLSSDASGNVLTVDGTGYAYSQLPQSFSWTVGSSHSFEWLTPISVGSTKRYVWSSTSGLSTSRSGSITVPSGGGSVTATYGTQYQWIFSASGLSSDASGTVVTVDSVNYGYSSLPVTFWWDLSSSHSYAYQQYVSTTTSGKRYANHNPPSGTITVSGSGSVNPAYHTEYQLTTGVSPSGAGSISLNPSSSDGYYDSGTSVTATATPNAGYAFSYWTLDGSNAGSSNPYTVTINAPHNLVAHFTGATYTLTVYVYRSGTSTGIQGVTVKVDGTSYTTGSGGSVSVTVSYGSHTVEIVSPYSPSSGTQYVFTQWSDGSTSNPRTISVSSGTTLTAYMKLQYYLTIQVSPSGAGSVSPSSGWHDSGSTVQISATVASGYVFSSWSGSGSGSYSGTSNPATVTMNGPVTETANFVQVATVTFSASGLSSDASGVVLIVDGTNYYYSNLPISFTWVVGSSHDFEWKTPISASSGKQYIWVSTGGLSTARSGSITVPSGGGSVSATYKTQCQWTFSASGLGSDASGTVVTVDGTGYSYSSLPLTFWWDSGSSHSYSYQQYVSSTTDGKRYANHSPPSATITVSSSGSVNPSYHVEYRLTISVSPSGAGTTSPSPGTYWYDSGTSVSVTASANSGYTFSYWTLDGQNAGTGNTINFQMNSPRSLTANFAQAFDFSVSANPSTLLILRGGSGSSTITATLVSGSAQTVSLSATVPSGITYNFNPSSGTPTFTSTLTLTASSSMSVGTYSVTVTGTGGGISRSTAITVRVYDFTVSVSPSSGTVTKPTSGSVSRTSTVTVTLLWSGEFPYPGFSVSLSSSNMPSGVQVSFNPQSGSVYPSSPFTSTMTITVSSSASPGTYNIAVPATLLGNSKSTTYTLTINEPFDFSVSVNPTSGSVEQGKSISATVTVTLISGSAQTVSLSASGLPSGASASFNPSSGNPTFTSTMTISVGASTSAGTYSITITGTGGGLTRTATYTLAVTQATATVTFSANGLGSDASGAVLTVDGVAYTYDDLPKSFTWEVGSSHSFSWSNPISATAGKRYVWISTSGLSTRRSGTITVPSGGGSVTATYKMQYYLTMQVNPSGAGTVSPSSSWHDAGMSVQISATPNSGYAFDSWSGSGTGSFSGTSNPAAVTMNEPITETAVFFTFSITVSPSSVTATRGGGRAFATVYATLVSGSSKTVTLSALNVPYGVSVSFSPSSGALPFSSSVTITVSSSSISLGTYTITIAGTGGGVTKSAALTLYIIDFTVSVSPSSGTVYLPSSGSASTTATVTVSLVSGSPSTLDVELIDMSSMSGVSVSLNPQHGNPTYSTTMTITVSSSASTGTYTITIWATEGWVIRQTSYTLTISLVPVTIRASFKYHGTYTNAWGDGRTLRVNINWGNSQYYTADQVGNGLTFWLKSGDTIYVYWYHGIYYYESSYVDVSTDYEWTSSIGLITSQNGYTTVPSSGGSIVAYYNRYIYVYTEKEPYNGGSVSPDSGYYSEGQQFTATANSGYQSHHWFVQDTSEWTSTSNPITMWDTGKLKAVFYIRVRVHAYDSEYNSFPNICVSCGPVSGYTNSYGYVDLYVPYGYNTLSVSSSGSGYGGKSLPFWKWSDGTTSTSRTIYVYQPTYYTAYYKCVLWFKEIHAETRCGPGTGFAVVYRTWGYAYVTTARSEYGKSGVTVKAVWHIHTEDLFGSHYFTREATGTTGSGGYFDFSTSGYDYWLVWEDLWVQVSAQVTDPRYYNQAYWTATYPFS